MFFNVIVGGGGEGVASAIGATEEGAEKVILIEKLTFLGGAMRARSGQYSAPDLFDESLFVKEIVDSSLGEF